MIRNLALRRTIAVMLALRERRHNLDELACRFGVSPRTIRRDIDVLRAADVPIRHVADAAGAEDFSQWWIDREFRL